MAKEKLPSSGADRQPSWLSSWLSKIKPQLTPFRVGVVSLIAGIAIAKNCPDKAQEEPKPPPKRSAPVTPPTPQSSHELPTDHSEERRKMKKSIAEKPFDVAMREGRNFFVLLDARFSAQANPYSAEETRKRREGITAYLNAGKRYVDTLREAYPDRKEVDELILFFEDLKGDVEHGRRPHLDESLVTISRGVEAEINKNKPSRIDIDESDSEEVKRVYSHLTSIGVNPEYVVAGKEDMPVIILAGQVHPFPGVPEDTLRQMGVFESQAMIEKMLISAHEKGISSTIFAEGIPAYRKGMMGTLPEVRLSPHEGVERARSRFGDQIDIRGYEDPLFTEKTMGEFKRGGTGGVMASLSDRVVFQNILIARNIANSMQKNNDRTATVTIGKGHEMSQPFKGMPQLPLSSLLAFKGYNVVVVDTHPE